MGNQATKALQARRRKAASRVNRLLVRAEAATAEGVGDRQRILGAARAGRQRLRTLETARRALAAKETEVGETILAITDQGLSRNDAYRLLDLSRAAGRRYVDRALRTGRNGRRPSTAERGHAATAAYGGQHPNQAPGTGSSPEGRNR